VGDLLSQLLRISSTSHTSNTAVPSINIAGPVSSEPPESHVPPPINQKTRDATAPWSLTASDAASTESALLPFLIHLAASRDDVDGIKFCVDADDRLFNAIAMGSGGGLLSGNVSRTMSVSLSASPGVASGVSGIQTVPRGVVNCIDGATRMSPLHVAALNGCQRATVMLLEYGALVHPRDVLDHTALYYVSILTQQVWISD